MQPNPRLIAVIVNLGVSLTITAVLAIGTSCSVPYLAGTG